MEDLGYALTEGGLGKALVRVLVFVAAAAALSALFRPVLAWLAKPNDRSENIAARTLRNTVNLISLVYMGIIGLLLLFIVGAGLFFLVRWAFE